MHHKYLMPWAVAMLLVFGSGVVGAIMYGTLARMGWATIIGACLP